MRKIKDKFDYDPMEDYIRLKAKGTLDLVPEDLKENYNLTDGEINLLRNLMIFKEDELLPIRVDGELNGEKVLAPPISVAVFDFYYGAKIFEEKEKELSVFNYLGFEVINFIDAETKIKMNLAKSIFRKVSPQLYSQCF
ncbi:hypothetical protein [Confluentibacter sediminis]|uniref:hypothetical protein n=1 Tax=Confluentibacter sediminis TaxID=2219045 RepID=UPI000DAD4337|nr:hypothetical protein [Confluentibacter sediminis]